MYGTAVMGLNARPLSLFASRSQDGDLSADTANPSAIWLPEIAQHASSTNSHEERNMSTRQYKRRLTYGCDGLHPTP
jgi:hypothetical protein